MKPRDLLLSRHQAAERKLDDIRHSALAALTDNTKDLQPGPLTFWRALLNPFRWHLVGLSAAWLLLAFLNIDSATQPSTATAAQNKDATPQDLLIAVRQNREQLMQLLETPSPEPAMPVYIPRRRGSLQLTNVAV